MWTRVAPNISEVCADNIPEPIRDNTERVAYFHSPLAWLLPMNYLLNCLCMWRSLILSQRYWLSSAQTTGPGPAEANRKNTAGDRGSEERSKVGKCDVWSWRFNQRGRPVNEGRDGCRLNSLTTASARSHWPPIIRGRYNHQDLMVSGALISFS